MRLTLQSIGDAVLCTDAQGRVTYINPVAQRMSAGRPSMRRIRMWMSWHRCIATMASAARPKPGARLWGRGSPVVLRVAWCCTARTDIATWSGSASPITDRHGHLNGAVMVLHDVTETMALAERTWPTWREYDALTDLPSRVLLQDRARQALALAQRDGKTLAVMYIDLDGFKQVNDTPGPRFGRPVAGAVCAPPAGCRASVGHRVPPGEAMSSWCCCRTGRAAAVHGGGAQGTGRVPRRRSTCRSTKSAWVSVQGWPSSRSTAVPLKNWRVTPTPPCTRPSVLGACRCTLRGCGAGA